MTAAPAPGPAAVNVLVVDDVPQNLLSMQALLRQPGVRVLVAASGVQALDILLEHDVALALLDVQMPEMDGFALAELIRGAQRTRDVPIIFLTALPDDPRRSFRGYEAGAVDFLHKPVDSRVVQSKVGVFVELYRQRRLLRERNEALERLLALNETMLAVLTHDLRSPLSAIVMSVDSLRRKDLDDASAKRIEYIGNSAARMDRMIEQLLHFSRIRSGLLTLRVRAGDLQAVCAAVVDELRQSRPAASIELAAAGDLLGTFDADRLSQVFSNLLGNALEHGAPAVPVRVALDGGDPRELRASVSNAGCIPQEALPRLFEPFKGGRQGHRGLGLGLYIADQFVRAHGGQLGCHNSGDSAVFELRLPRAPQA